MKAYEMIYNQGETEGVFGISLVESPAMQGQFIALSDQEQKVQFAEVDKEQRILVGLVLEPNKPIYRNQNGNEFTIQASEDTVKEMCYAFTKNNHNKNSTIEHESPIEGVTFVENWLVRDPKMDTALSFGLEPQKGSWMTVLKVDSDNVWENYVKTGKVLGFSIDAIIKLKEIKMSNEKEKVSFIAQLKEVLSGYFEKPEKVELGSVKLEDGSITLMYDGEVLEAGVPVYTIAEDNTKVPAPVGEHKLEDGNILVITEEGITAEVKPMATETPEPENLEAEPMETGNEMQDLVNAIKKVTVQYSEDQEKEKTVLTELREEVDTLKAEIVELKKAPASQPIKKPAQKSYDEMTNFEKVKFNRGLI